MQKEPYELIEMSDEDESTSMCLELNKDINTTHSQQLEQFHHKNHKEMEFSIDTIMDTIETGDYNAHELMAQNGYVEITIVKSQKDKSKDDNIKNFINFCLEKKLFNDDYYDSNNVFSIISTKLPATFDSISENKKTVSKEIFINIFKEKYNYTGDLLYIYHLMDCDLKGHITWDDFREFFLPYVRHVEV